MVTVTNTLNCEPIVEPVDSGLSVRKFVVSNAPVAVANLTFPISATCVTGTGSGTLDNSASHNLAHGQTQTYLPYMAGGNCTVTEGVMPVTTACGKGKNPVWTTTYSPSQTVAMSSAGTLVTVTNTLDCEPIVIGGGKSTFSVSKEASFNGQPILGTSFQMNVTCDDGTAQSLNVLSGQSQTIENLPSGTTCNVVEGKIGTTNLCPKGSVENWTTTYSPANGSNTTDSNTSVIVRVNNLLTCKPVDSSMYVKKIVVNNAPGSIDGMAFNIQSVCTGGSQATGSANLTDGQTVLFHNYEAGMSCTLSEMIPVTTACGKAKKPVWTTTYSPSQTVALSASGETITVTNTLNCEGINITVCPPGMFWNGEICLPNCPPLTTWDGNFCKPDCPPLTQWDGNFCKPTCPPLTTWDGNFCKPDCPPLTQWDGNFCKPTCPPLTTWDGNLCRPDCPPLTEWNGSICQPNCPPLTQWDGTWCKPVVPWKLVQPTTDACEPGFHLVEDKCVQDRAACNPATTTQAGDLCRCRFDNMNQVSKTACECKPGFTLKAGQGCVRKVVEPRCDPATTVARGGKCVCEYRNMVQTSATACACAKGFRFAAGKGCFRPEPVCGKNQNLVNGRCLDKPPVCGRNQVLLKGRCTDKPPVCGRNQVLVKGRCVNKEPVCRPPFKYDAKRRACVEQIQRCEPGQIRVRGKCIRVPKCGFGQIPVPGTGICVSIGGGGPKGDDRPKGDNGRP